MHSGVSWGALDASLSIRQSFVGDEQCLMGIWRWMPPTNWVVRASAGNIVMPKHLALEAWLCRAFTVNSVADLRAHDAGSASGAACR